LTAENQYSIAPNTFTLRALTSTSSAENPTIHGQPGEVGNQKCM